MDIHRSRFVPYPASAINALAFSHATGESLRSDGQNSNLRLAVGRANGDIEIWNPSKGEWLQETIFRGGRDRSVEGLAWVQEPDDLDKKGKLTPGKLRLFSIGYSSTVTEWDLLTGLPKRNSSGTFAEVWCLAAQPRLKKKNITGQHAGQIEEFHGQNLAAGCADGTLAILSTADDNLQFQKFVSIQTARRARCLSVTFRDRDIVVAGFADSTIRIFDSRNSSLLRTVSFSAGAAGAPREVLVWAVKCLPNGDIVAGDSTGEVHFFDGKNFSQYQRITGHEADILDIAVSKDGRSIWSAGMDRRTVLYVNNASSSSGRQWAKASHRIHHEHDVKAMATFENKKLSMIASGGLDTNLVILPMRGYGTEYHRTISGLPQVQPLLSLPSKRLLVAWWDRDVSIWRFNRRHQDSKPYKLMAKIVLKGDESITSATIAKCSETTCVLAISTAAELKFFTLTELSSGTLAVEKLSHRLTQQSARIIQFSADGKWMALATHRNEIYLARFSASKRKAVRVLSTSIHLKRPNRRPTAGHSQPGPLGAYTHIITRLKFSPDSRVLVAGKLDGYIEGWILAGHEDATAPEIDIPQKTSSDTSDSDLSSTEDEAEEIPPIMIYGQFWSRIPGIRLLPKLDSPPQLISFRPSASRSEQDATAGESSVEPNGNPAVHPTRSNPRPLPHYVPKGPYHLVVLTAHHNLYEFDLLRGRLTDWSNRNPTSRLPNQFRQVRDRAVGCLWHTKASSQMWWLWGVNWVWMFDLSQDLPGSESNSSTQTNGVSGGLLSNKKRKRGESGAGGPLKRKDMQGLGLVATKPSKSIMTAQPQASSAVVELQESDDEEVVLEPQLSTEAGEAMSEQHPPGAKSGRRKTWFSFKYRPILGIVLIGDDADIIRHPNTRKLEETNGIDTNGQSEGEAAKQYPVEVVLVERPVWDLDLPPRYEILYKQ